jgi:hypothetical protein
MRNQRRESEVSASTGYYTDLRGIVEWIAEHYARNEENAKAH